tara:strand:- start:3893 stop:4534 length:642 start_codon:yes stop_codon:yes gene_type:complete
MISNTLPTAQLATVEQSVDPLEYLAQLTAKSISIEVVERRRSSTKLAHASGKEAYTARRIGLVGSEHGAMLKGLKHGPRDVAHYRTTYSMAALQQLQRSLAFEAAAISNQRQWRIRKDKSLVGLCCILAISEKYFNVCKICNGSTQKQDRKPCKSCDNGFATRTQRECSEFLGMDHKNYARTWKSRVAMLISILDDWENEAKEKIAFNVHGSS